MIVRGITADVAGFITKEDIRQKRTDMSNLQSRRVINARKRYKRTYNFTIFRSQKLTKECSKIMDCPAIIRVIEMIPPQKIVISELIYRLIGGNISRGHL